MYKGIQLKYVYIKERDMFVVQGGIGSIIELVAAEGGFYLMVLGFRHVI